jgi:hypothetical protein
MECLPLAVGNNDLAKEFAIEMQRWSFPRPRAF